MTDKQERYFSSCRSQVIWRLLQYLLNRTNTKNGFVFTIELKEIGIEESVRIRQLHEHRLNFDCMMTGCLTGEILVTFVDARLSIPPLRRTKNPSGPSPGGGQVALASCLDV